TGGNARNGKAGVGRLRGVTTWERRLNFEAQTRQLSGGQRQFEGVEFIVLKRRYLGHIRIGLGDRAAVFGLERNRLEWLPALIPGKVLFPFRLIGLGFRSSRLESFFDAGNFALDFGALFFLCWGVKLE